MSIPLLRTKLFAPPARPGLVRRPHLIERLDKGLLPGGGVARQLSLISAPPGFGKTTLLSEWIQPPGGGDSRIVPTGGTATKRVAWLSLDEGDNDLARFLAYLAAALESLEPDAGDAAHPDPRQAGAEEVLTVLINRVARLDGPCLLVLDDYHLISARPVHDAVALLLEHLPANLHLAIATRVDPPLPIARLRGRGQLTELRQADLRFGPDEVAAFVAEAVGTQVSARDLEALAARTEGWAAGLQMAALAMQGPGRTSDARDPSAFIRSFSGSHRFILDYLVEEVLGRQPAALQTFLLKTSILERLTAPLCDELLGEGMEGGEGQEDRASSVFSRPSPGSPAQATLEHLEALNLFIIPLDGERRWYRYHRLFADLLQQRLHETYPGEVPALHHRASAWYEAHGFVTEAIDHALDAADFPRAAALIESVAEATLMRSEVITLRRWVERLPEAQVRAHPTLGLLHAWALLLSGQPLDEIEARLEGLKPAVGGDASADLMTSRLATLRAFVAIFQGESDSAASLSRQALEQLPEDDLFLRGMAAWLLGLSMTDGDPAASVLALDEAARTSQAMGNVMAAVEALRHLAGQRVRQGQLFEALAIGEQALALAVDRQGRPLPAAGEVHLILGELWREWNDLEAAERHLLAGIELARQGREITAFPGYLSLARVRQSRGDASGSLEAVDQARQIIARFDVTTLDDTVVGLGEVRLHIAQGDLAGAARLIDRWAPAGGADLVPVSARLHKYWQLMRARLALAQDRPEDALALVDPLLPGLVTQGRVRLAIEIQVLRAVALQACNEDDSALAALAEALAWAEPGGLVRTFLDAGEPMARLLRRAAAGGLAPRYVDRLLAAFAQERQAGAPVPAAVAPTPTRRPAWDASGKTKAPGLVEALSERELEVLRYLNSPLSSTEIAEQLFISVNTVRSHIRNIYGKLGVHSRYEALARASELELL